MTDQSTQTQDTGTQTGDQPTQTQTASSPFLSALPEEYRSNETFTKFIDPATKDLSLANLAKSYAHLEQAAGWPADQVLRIPKADDAEGWAGVYTRLGRPEAADKYDLSGFETKNEGDKAFVDNFRGEAFKLGMSQTQMSGIMAYLGTSVGTLEKAYADQLTEQRTAANAELDKAWGDRAKVYRGEIPNTVTKLAEWAGLFDPAKPEDGKAIYEKLNADGLADNPALMRIFAALGDKMAEGGLLPGTGREDIVDTGGMTPEEGRAKLDAFMSKKENVNAIHDTRDALHKTAKAEYMRLIAAASPRE